MVIPLRSGSGSSSKKSSSFRSSELGFQNPRKDYTKVGGFGLLGDNWVGLKGLIGLARFGLVGKGVWRKEFLESYFLG